MSNKQKRFHSFLFLVYLLAITSSSNGVSSLGVFDAWNIMCRSLSRQSAWLRICFRVFSDVTISSPALFTRFCCCLQQMTTFSFMHVTCQYTDIACKCKFLFSNNITEMFCLHKCVNVSLIQLDINKNCHSQKWNYHAFISLFRQDVFL